MEKQEQPYLTLTKKERERLGKRVLHRYHDLGERVYSNPAEELFEGTGIPIEIIREELARIKPELRVQKSKKEKSLESQMVNSPLFGWFFVLPTMINLPITGDMPHTEGEYILYKRLTIAGGVLETMSIYMGLGLINPKLILPVAITQITTNLASGYHEWRRSVKKRTEEKEQKTPRLDRDPAGHLEGMYDQG